MGRVCHAASRRQDRRSRTSGVAMCGRVVQRYTWDDVQDLYDLPDGPARNLQGLGNALQEPPPLRFPENHLAIDATNDRVLDHSVIVIAPIARVPAFDAGLGARFAEEEGHYPIKEQTGNEIKSA